MELKTINLNLYPACMDLFKRAEEQEQAADAFGFAWEHVDQLIAQAQSECLEIKEAFHKGDRTHLQEEIGDLIHASIALAVFCKMDPRKTLQDSIDKFQRRFDRVVALAKEDGLTNLKNQPYSTLMHYWDRAKNGTQN